MRLLRSTVLSVFLASVAISSFAIMASAQTVIMVEVPPPPLPDYDQPDIPGPGYIWIPGYWAFDDDYGYYWVPGTWVLPPQDGLLWTPGYWVFEDSNYVYYEGYWGEEVGFYGGVDYGYGYEGDGYDGGYWQGGAFFYNTTVNNVAGMGIANVFSKPVVRPANVRRVSYNGGPGGLTLRPTQQQQSFAHERHVGLTTAQREHVQMASREPSLRETQNKGLPPIAATSHPDDFKGPGVVTAKTAGERPSGQSIPQGKKGPGLPNGPTPGVNGGKSPGTTTPGGPAPGGPAPGGAAPENKPVNIPGGERQPVTLPEEHRAQPQTGEHKPVLSAASGSAASAADDSAGTGWSAAASCAASG